MKTKEEQIQVILSGNTFQWASNQINSVKKIDHKKYDDFISVTEQEIEEYVISNGFGDSAVYENDGTEAWSIYDAHDRICIAQENEQWLVLHMGWEERLEISMSLEKGDAIREVIKRLINMAKISLNNRYQNAHSENKESSVCK